MTEYTILEGDSVYAIAKDKWVIYTAEDEYRVSSETRPKVGDSVTDTTKDLSKYFEGA